jgi:hypothetical protein
MAVEELVSGELTTAFLLRSYSGPMSIFCSKDAPCFAGVASGDTEQVSSAASAKNAVNNSKRHTEIIATEFMQPLFVDGCPVSETMSAVVDLR